MKRTRERAFSLQPQASSSTSGVDLPPSNASTDSSDNCYGCGRNWKKKNLNHFQIDRTSKPPQTGKYPVLIDPACPHSDSLCQECYDSNRADLGKSTSFQKGDRSSPAREFICDNSDIKWCPRLIISVALFTSLVSFFIGVIEKAGMEISYNLSFEEGVAILLINLGGKFYEWTSSSFKVNTGNRHREYSLNAFISNSIYLAGNRVTPLLRFLDLIGVWHQSKPAIHNRNEKQLLPAVKKYFEKMMGKVRAVLYVKGKQLHLQEDEQHSREARKRGQAPFCTAVIIESITRLIMARSHVQKKDHPGKALANICQLEVVKTLALLLAVSGVLVATFGVDGCTTALGVFTTCILKQWPLAKLGRDNWHKMKDWGSKFAEFCSQNTKKGAHDRLCPRISELFDLEKLLVFKIKNHFIYCANTCNGNVELFKESFLDLADHYGEKFSIPGRSRSLQEVFGVSLGQRPASLSSWNPYFPLRIFSFPLQQGLP